MAELSDLITVPEAANELGVTQGAVRIALDEGRLPFQTVVGRRVVTRTDLDTYKQRTRPSGEKPKGRPRKSVSSSGHGDEVQ